MIILAVEHILSITISKTIKLFANFFSTMLVVITENK